MSELVVTRATIWPPNVTCSRMKYTEADLREVWNGYKSPGDFAAAHAPDHYVVGYPVPNESDALLYAALFVRFMFATPGYTYWTLGWLYVNLGQFYDYGNGCDDIRGNMKQWEDILHDPSPYLRRLAFAEEFADDSEQQRRQLEYDKRRAE